MKLVAVANQFGDNPLMPMAEQSFMAVIAVGGSGTSPEVRVLFFEYVDSFWYLQGELITADHADDWLTGNCQTCYDAWVAWPN